MSLTPIAEAFLLVAVVFNAAGVLAARWAIGDPGSGGRGPGTATSGPGPRAPGPGLLSRVWPGATFEALVLTLVAALWFGSLGHGGWVVLFLLLGALPAGAAWRRRRLAGAPAGGAVPPFVASLLAYLLAGLVCAQLLS